MQRKISKTKIGILLVIIRWHIISKCKQNNEIKSFLMTSSQGKICPKDMNLKTMKMQLFKCMTLTWKFLLPLTKPTYSWKAFENSAVDLPKSSHYSPTTKKTVLNAKLKEKSLTNCEKWKDLLKIPTTLCSKTSERYYWAQFKHIKWVIGRMKNIIFSWIYWKNMGKTIKK